MNENDNAAAARLFALGARVIQPGLNLSLRSRARALAFNESVPCAERILSIHVVGIRATEVQDNLVGVSPEDGVVGHQMRTKPSDHFRPAGHQPGADWLMDFWILIAEKPDEC